MRLIDADQFGVIALQGKSEDFIEGVLFILDKIYEAPTIEERPHGEWIKFTLEGGFLSSHKCSNCGFCGNQLWHYCPGCGASMVANDRQVTGKLNSEIEKSKSEIVPDYRDGWRLRGEAE